ncbi:MAG: nucleotide pyrophosphohydrolase [bacterium]
MTDKTKTIAEIKKVIQDFVNARDWGQFHDPKNLSIMTITEAAELLEVFRWVKNDSADEHAQKNIEKVKHEVVDVFFSIILLCNRCNIDLVKALEEKMTVNAQRYPVEKIKGKSLKYTEL